jgi:hypothetical protein
MYEHEKEEFVFRHFWEKIMDWTNIIATSTIWSDDNCIYHDVVGSLRGPWDKALPFRERRP